MQLSKEIGMLNYILGLEFKVGILTRDILYEIAYDLIQSGVFEEEDLIESEDGFFLNKGNLSDLDSIKLSVTLYQRRILFSAYNIDQHQSWIDFKQKAANSITRFLLNPNKQSTIQKALAYLNQHAIIDVFKNKFDVSSLSKHIFSSEFLQKVRVEEPFLMKDFSTTLDSVTDNTNFILSLSTQEKNFGKEVVSINVSNPLFKLNFEKDALKQIIEYSDSFEKYVDEQFWPFFRAMIK